MSSEQNVFAASDQQVFSLAKISIQPYSIQLVLWPINYNGVQLGLANNLKITETSI